MILANVVQLLREAFIDTPFREARVSKLQRTPTLEPHARTYIDGDIICVFLAKGGKPVIWIMERSGCRRVPITAKLQELDTAWFFDHWYMTGGPGEITNWIKEQR